MMSEEFVTDIIGTDEAPAKSESEMIAELKDATGEKAPEKQSDVKDAEVKMGSEATPDESQQEVKVAPDAKAEDVKTDDPEPDVVKELAAQLGWREEHTGDDAVDAKTYILKSKDIQKSMGQHNKDLKNQLKALDGSVESLKEHNESVYKAQVKKLTGEVSALKKERRAAIELADVTKVEELDQQIDDIQKDIDKPKADDKKESTAADNPAYDEWIKDNQWYTNDDEMAKFADTVAQQYDGAPPDRVYALVRNKVKEVFPEKFESAKVPEIKKDDSIKSDDAVKPPVGPKSPVESSSAKGNEVSFTKADLTSAQLNIMRQFVQGGIMTEEAYVKDIAKLQE